MKHILSLDQGTTSSRAVLFDAAGAPVDLVQREFRQIFPRPGWVEHDANEIWESQIAVAREVLARRSLHPRDLAAIGITNQRETVVVWERKSGRPISNAIVWQDRRTAAVCGELVQKGLEPGIQRKTGLVLDAYFSATKLNWILDHVPGARARAEAGELAAGTIDTWLLWKLTEGRVHATDATNASRTLLFSLTSGAWDDELLRIFDIPRSILPEVRDSQGVIAEARGDLAGVPIAGVAGDQQAALFGQVCTRPGMVKNTYGTGCFLLMHAGETPAISKHRLLSTVASRIGGRDSFALEGSVFVAGAAVQWLRDGLGIIRSSSEVEPLAASVADAGGVYFVPALTGLGAPQWDPYARGTIVGLTRGSTAAHLARATLEGIAQQVADVIEAMELDSGVGIEELRVDGGAARNDLLLQMQADLLGAPVVRPKVTETTAQGAAFLAGLAVGFWKDLPEIERLWAVDRRFEPKIVESERVASRAAWKRALERSRGWETAR